MREYLQFACPRQLLFRIILVNDIRSEARITPGALIVIAVLRESTVSRSRIGLAHTKMATKISGFYLGVSLCPPSFYTIRMLRILMSILVVESQNRLLVKPNGAPPERPIHLETTPPCG